MNEDKTFQDTFIYTKKWNDSMKPWSRFLYIFFNYEFLFKFIIAFISLYSSESIYKVQYDVSFWIFFKATKQNAKIFL